MPSKYEEGDPKSRICILGEAPSRMETRMGRPFIGPSGKLLESCMHAAGVARKECYLLNIWEEEVKKSRTGDRIMDQDGETLWTPKGGMTALGEHMSSTTLTRLKNCSANVFVPLGGTALSYLFGDTRITKWRGSILQSPRLDRKLVPAIHPAASLRGNYLWRHLIAADLKRAKEESLSPELDLPQRDILIRPTFQDVEDYLATIKKTKKTGVDIECLNHQVSCISFALRWDTAIVIPFVGEGGEDYWSIEDEAKIWLMIADIMGDPEIMKIGQNLIFDMSFMLRQNNVFTRGPIGDTMIAHHIVWPDFLKGLDFICSMLTREPYYKDDGKMWRKPWADLEVFWIYNGKDSCVAIEIWDAIQPELDDGFRRTYNETIELFDPLLFMMTKGMEVNKDELQKTKQKVEAEIKTKEEELVEVAEVSFNPLSPKQCQDYFYVTKGIKPYVSRKTGRPTTDDKAMARIFRKHNLREAKLVQEIRSLRKLHGTYLDVGIDPDGRIRSSYGPRGTVTGRLNSSQSIFGTGMNMQNLHPEFKGFLVADSV